MSETGRAEWEIPFGAPRLTGDGSSGMRSARLQESGEPLRLSSGVVDVAPAVPAAPSTDDQFAALNERLLALSDPWSKSAHAFVGAYLAFVEHEIARSAEAIMDRLADHGGLYAPDDLRFSAWLPLPQAHVPGTSGSVRFPFAFWSGREILAVVIGAADRPVDPAALLPPVRLLTLGAADLAREPVAALRSVLPRGAIRFWDGVEEPAAPFRTADARLAL